MRWGDWSGDSGALTTFLSWFGDMWPKGSLLLLENWGWVCICAKWAEFRLCIYVWNSFFPYFFSLHFYLVTLTTLLSVTSALLSVVQVPHKDNQVLQPVDWKSSDCSAFSLRHVCPPGVQTMIWSWRREIFPVNSKICTCLCTLVQIERSWCLPTPPAACQSSHGAETGRVMITIIVSVLNAHMHNARTLRWNWKVAVDETNYEISYRIETSIWFPYDMNFSWKPQNGAVPGQSQLWKLPKLCQVDEQFFRRLEVIQLTKSQTGTSGCSASVVRLSSWRCPESTGFDDQAHSCLLNK